MLIDLHCHTRKIKSGDGVGREVSDELFHKKVIDSGVEIIAVTNHNIFDKAQFIRLQKRVKDYCKLWPGIELDISYGEEGDRYHLLVICNPKNIDAFKYAVAEITDGSTPEDFIIDVARVVETFDPLDSLFLPHFNKSPGIPESEYDNLKSLLRNPSRLIAEATNVRSMGIFVSHDINSIAGSDIKDWNKYPAMELPELRLRVEEYEHFCKLLDRDSSIVKTLLDKNTPTSFDVYPCKGNRDVKERHRFFKEINVIFGDKGTGKTEVIKSLVTKLKTEDIPFSYYISSETKESLDELMITSDMSRSPEILGKKGCESSFELINNWGDRSPTPIAEYIEYHKTSTAKENQRRVGWSRMADLADDSDIRLEKTTADLMSALDGAHAINTVRLSEYLDELDSQSVIDLLEKLVSAIRKSESRLRISHVSGKLTNFTLEKFRAYTAAKTGSATRPSGTGFKQFANNRLVLMDAMSEIVDNLTFREKKDYELLGTTGGKGKIEIEKRYRMLNDLPETKSSHKEFNGNKIKLDDVKKSLTKVKSLALSCLLDDPLADLKSKLEEAHISSIGDFIGIYKQTVDKDRNPYTPSNGERSIIFIQRALNNPDAKIFLLDEPELSMANSYIDEVIRPRISELGRQKKTVILATHNANLAVRTLPYTTIYRSHDSDGYKIYVGNPFTNKLINIDNEEDTRDWKETSMKILEGGREAFYDREGIYESGR